MGALREEEKPDLLDEQQALKDAQAAWGGVLGVLSAVGLVINPAISALPVAVGAISVAVMKRKQNAVDRILADPPRFDYEIATRARRRRYEPGSLGGSPLALATDQAAIATLRAASYLEASVRADERAEGARIVGRLDLADWHLEEAKRLLEMGRSWAGEMSAAWDVHAISWAAFAVDTDLAEIPLPDDIHAPDLNLQAREALDRTRLVFDDLDFTSGRFELDEIQSLPGRSTVGDLALESAVTSREVSWSSGRVAGGARALPERTVERPLPSAIRVEDLRTLRAGGRPKVEGAEQRLLSAVEEGSPDAMFDLGLLSYARGDRVRAQTLLGRAAATTAPLPAGEYLEAVRRVPELNPPLPPIELEAGESSKVPEKVDRDLVERYWSALSDNGRAIFGAAAAIESEHGPGYTLEDIAEHLDLDYESVRSMHRSTGRTAKAWRRDSGTEEPIRLEWERYDWDESRGGRRTSYRLPSGVADLVNELRDRGVEGLRDEQG